MSTVPMTVESFVTTVDRPGIVLVDFWASWCGPCRAFAPVFEAASARHPDVVFAKVDTDAERELATAFRIQSIPTLMAFRDGVLVYSRPGMVSAAALDELVRGVRALDMAEVNRVVQERESESRVRAASGRR